VREAGVLQVGDDLVDDRVAAVIGLRVKHRPRGESVNMAVRHEAL
jgi:3-deoxy-D-manno-octulosonate 8-phosphate phosphatase KdsC-like HAD superfamily phosphatase